MVLELLGNTTQLPAVAWHSEPTTRGTIGILTSCLVTMSLCVWTTLHLNLPAHKDKGQLRRRLKWLMIGLLTPEVVMLNAWTQRRAMKAISKTMRDRGWMFKEEPSIWESVRTWIRTAWNSLLAKLFYKAPNSPPMTYHMPAYNGRAHCWTDLHSWFVLMGGLAFDDNAPEDEQFMSNGRQRVTLTVAGLSELLKVRPDLVPDISKQEIQAKNQSDPLAKLITLWQISYFCIQLLLRLEQQLSITLLEINVFAHALLALILMSEWMNKPQDLLEPTLIYHEDGLDICALFCLQTDQGGENGPCGWHSHWEAIDPPTPGATTDCWEVTPGSKVSAERYLEGGHIRNGFGPSGQPYMKVLGSFWTIKNWNPRPVNMAMECQMDSRTCHRLERAYKVILSNPRAARAPPGVKLVCSRVSDWIVDLRDVGQSLQLDSAAVLFCAGLCYGGVHALAWHSKFPSLSETVLWRAASVSIMATGPLILVPYVYSWTIAQTRHWIERQPLFRRYLEKDTAFYHCIGAVYRYSLPSLCLLLALWYILCRTFIVVECFFMLARIQDTALHVPQLARYLPDIG